VVEGEGDGEGDRVRMGRTVKAATGAAMVRGVKLPRKKRRAGLARWEGLGVEGVGVVWDSGAWVGGSCVMVGGRLEGCMRLSL
jgi:hypothetical protein